MITIILALLVTLVIKSHDPSSIGARITTNLGPQCSFKGFIGIGFIELHSGLGIIANTIPYGPYTIHRGFHQTPCQLLRARDYRYA